MTQAESNVLDKVKRSEAEVKRSIEELLKSLSVFYLRMNAGDRFGSYKGKTWRIKGHAAGTADILCFPLCRPPNTGRTVLWIECKSSTGKMSPAQDGFAEMVGERGHYYLLARSAASVADFLKERGFI